MRHIVAFLLGPLASTTLVRTPVATTARAAGDVPETVGPTTVTAHVPVALQRLTSASARSLVRLHVDPRETDRAAARGRRSG